MSMPQPLTIAIVCSDSAKLNFLRENTGLSKEKISPEYHFVTPLDDIEKIVNPNNYLYAFVELWIALDNASLQYCRFKEIENRNNKNYSRGFYEKLLPEPVLYIDENSSINIVLEKLKDLMNKILLAFYETS